MAHGVHAAKKWVLVILPHANTMKNANKQRTTRLRMDKLSQIMFALAPCLVRSRDGTYPAPVSFVHARFCLTLREGRERGGGEEEDGMAGKVCISCERCRLPAATRWCTWCSVQTTEPIHQTRNQWDGRGTGSSKGTHISCREQIFAKGKERLEFWPRLRSMQMSHFFIASRKRWLGWR